MANRGLPCPCNVVHKIIVWSNRHGIQLEYLEAYISKLDNTDKVIIFHSSFISWQIQNSKYIDEMDCNDGYTTIVTDVFVR